MVSILIFLTAFSLVLMIVGTVWGLVVRGKTTKIDSVYFGEVQKVTKYQDGLSENSEVSSNQTLFYGHGIQVKRTAFYSYEEIKQFLKTGNWILVMPPVLSTIGFLAFLFFLSLTLFVTFDEIIFGAIILGFFLYAAYFILTAFNRKSPS